jgi:hypothetical protein
MGSPGSVCFASTGGIMTRRRRSWLRPAQAPGSTSSEITP